MLEESVVQIIINIKSKNELNIIGIDNDFLWSDKEKCYKFHIEGWIKDACVLKNIVFVNPKNEVRQSLYNILYTHVLQKASSLAKRLQCLETIILNPENDSVDAEVEFIIGYGLGE